MVTETDIALADGRVLHSYDTGSVGIGELTVVWHHGTPNIGAPPSPLLPAAAERGIRFVSYDRPAYGGSTPHPDRNIASAAADVEALADALMLDRFAVISHSGGGPHALACAALLPDRVLAAACFASPAPFGAQGLDWYAGMGASGAAELRASVRGRDTLASVLASGEFDPEMFTAADHAALAGDWGWLGEVAGKALELGPDGMIDDDLAYVAPWGFDPADVARPVLLVHGAQDRVVPSSHSRWLAARCPSAELRITANDGHISVLNSGIAALDYLCERAAPEATSP